MQNFVTMPLPGKGVSEDLWLPFVQNAGLRLSTTSPCSAINAVRNCRWKYRKNKAIFARIAKQKSLTGKRSPVHDVVFRYQQIHPLPSHSSQQKTAPNVMLRLLMKAGIIVKHAGHISVMHRQEKCLWRMIPHPHRHRLKNRLLYRESIRIPVPGQ